MSIYRIQTYFQINGNHRISVLFQQSPQESFDTLILAMFRYKAHCKSAIFHAKSGINMVFLAANRILQFAAWRSPCGYQKPHKIVSSEVILMTDSQKHQVRAMRMQSIGYKAIARSLGLKINQVQLFCKAHGLAGDNHLVDVNYQIWCQQNSRCPICGAKISQPKTGRRKKFCSGRCRTRYCREQKGE